MEYDFQYHDTAFDFRYPVEFDLNLSLWWYAEPELNEQMELVICEPEPRYSKPFPVSNLLSYLAIENQLAMSEDRQMGGSVIESEILRI